MFADPFRHWRLTQPEKTAVIDRGTGERYSYSGMDARIDAAAGRLRALGITRGERVGVLAMNRIEQIDLFYACQRVGAALVPFNWRLTASELTGIIADARVKVCFGEERFRELADCAQLDCAWIDFDRDVANLETVQGDDVVNEANDAALVLYTSGSTGKPKGAVLPHRQILFNGIATTTAWQLSSDDVAAITTPFFHTGGWNVFATPLWQRGGTVVLMEKFEPDTFLVAMAEAQCTVALTVPTQLVMLMQSSSWGIELPNLRSFFSGGAPCPVSVQESVREAGYALREGYGLTECGPNCFTIGPDQAISRPGVVGWPVPFLEMRTVDETLRDVGDGEVGELLLRGPQMFAGYLNDPERTSEAVTADGWLRTGDLAIRNAEGAYSIVGRRKEMYISGGENVYPGEVEAALCACPGIIEVVVVGVQDARWGEVGRAFVVPRADSSIREEDVLAFAGTRLARYKTPRSVVFVDELPRLGSGKIDRKALLTWP
jgi:fatty-acyl-CoA synthase